MAHDENPVNTGAHLKDLAIYPSDSLVLPYSIFFDDEDSIVARPADHACASLLSPLGTSPSQLENATPFSDGHMSSATKAEDFIPTIVSPDHSTVAHDISVQNQNGDQLAPNCNGNTLTSIGQQLPSNVHTALYLDSTPCSENIETSQCKLESPDDCLVKSGHNQTTERDVNAFPDEQRNQNGKHQMGDVNPRDVNDLLELGAPIQLPCSSGYQTMTARAEAEMLQFDEIPIFVEENGTSSSGQPQKCHETLVMIEDLLSLSSKPSESQPSAATTAKTEALPNIDVATNDSDLYNILDGVGDFDNLSVVLPPNADDLALHGATDMNTIPLEIESILRTVPQDLLTPHDANKQSMKRKASCLTVCGTKETKPPTMPAKKARTGGAKRNKQNASQLPQQNSQPKKEPAKKRNTRAKRKEMDSEPSFPDAQGSSHGNLPHENEREQKIPKREHIVGPSPSCTPSRFCHICTRSAKPNDMLICSNVKRGTCRKIICFRCVRDVRWDWGAMKDDESWICTHCRNVRDRPFYSQLHFLWYIGNDRIARLIEYFLLTNYSRISFRFLFHSSFWIFLRDRTVPRKHNASHTNGSIRTDDQMENTLLRR